MSNSKNGVHILVFPFPAQGHMLPLLDLTHQLSQRGLSITILITPKNLPILNPLLTSNPSIQTLILPFPNHPSLPHGVENVRDIGNHGNIPIMSALSLLQGQIVQWFESHSNPPVALLSDFFLGWTHHLAEQLGIPRICFYCCASFLISVNNHLFENEDAVIPGDEITFHDLPSGPSFKWEHVPSLFRRYRMAEPRLEFVKDSIMANKLSWASVYDNFVGLEDEFLDYFKKQMGQSRVFSVGPLNLLARFNKSSNDDYDDEKLGVLSWLDQFADGSVLYVCFGSQKLLKKAQIEALAIGLERSGVRFVWVVKTPTAQQVEDGYGTIPDGFEERILGRGLVIKGWAPQVRILNHRSVGGFLSHCGWNSVMEAIGSGVMILGWPMEADQFVNAKLLVDYQAAAFRICEGGDTVPDPDELSKRISGSMHENVIERVKAKELRDKAFEAIKDGGTSNRDLDVFVQELGQLQVKIV